MSALAIDHDIARHGIGGNNPPLAEVLADETGELKRRAEDLAAGVGRAVVTDEDTAGKATLLAKMIKGHLTLIDDTREERKKPFLESGRAVDAHFNGIATILAEMDSKKKLVGGPLANLMGKIDAFRRDQEAKAEAERRRLQEEARKQREAAEAAERARLAAEAEARRAQEEADRKVREAEEAAQRAGNAAAAAEARRQREAADAIRLQEEAAARERNLQAEIDRHKAAQAAEDLERQAAATVAGPINSGYGAKAFSRAAETVVIEDFKLALKHALKTDETAIRAAVQQVYDRLLKAKIRDLPGARIETSSKTVIR